MVYVTGGWVWLLGKTLKPEKLENWNKNIGKKLEGIYSEVRAAVKPTALINRIGFTYSAQPGLHFSTHCLHDSPLHALVQYLIRVDSKAIFDWF